MIEDGAPGQLADAAGTDTPADGTPAIDWEQRYNEARPELDRTRQELAAAKEAAQAWQRFQETPEEVLRELGYAVEDDEPDPSLTDTGDLTGRELADLRRQMQEIQQTVGGMTEAQQQAALEQGLRASIDEQFAALPAGLDDGDEQWIASRAGTLPPRPDGMPDIAAAHADYQALQTQLQKRWADTKNGPRSPLNGTEGNHDPFPEDLTGDALTRAMVEEITRRQSATV
jgi:hypothetical protein